MSTNVTQSFFLVSSTQHTTQENIWNNQNFAWFLRQLSELSKCASFFISPFFFYYRSRNTRTKATQWNGLLYDVYDINVSEDNEGMVCW